MLLSSHGVCVCGGGTPWMEMGLGGLDSSLSVYAIEN